MAFGLRGLSHIVSNGCTSSTDAIAYAAEHIALGRQEAMLAGGSDAPLAPGILAGFCLMKVCTEDWTTNPPAPRAPSRATVRGWSWAKAPGSTCSKSTSERVGA